MSILSGILQHFSAKRANSPVCQLVLFICNDSTILLQQEGETESFELENSRCLTCVKHIDDVEAKVSLKPLDIHVSTVEHLDLLWIIEYWAQTAAYMFSQCNNVNQEVLESCRNLHETCETLVRPHCVSLKVYRYLFDSFFTQMVHHLNQRFLAIDELAAGFLQGFVLFRFNI